MIARRLLLTWVLAALAAPPCLAQPARPAGDTSLLPPDGFLGAWKVAGRARIFTHADLYGYIDGGAELFLELGFEQLTQQKYQSGSEQITVDLYRMTDLVASAGIYLAKCGRETPDRSFAERHTANRYQLMFERHRYFAIVANASGSERLAPDVTKFAAFVASRLPPSAPLAALSLLPPAGLVNGSVRLIRGPVGLQSIFTLGEGDILQLGGRITAVAGEYAEAGGGRSSRIEVVYPSALAAGAAMAHLQSSLDSYLTVVSRSRDRLVFRDYEKTFGVASVSASRLSVRLHLKEPPR